ncbi:MAG: ATP synthase F1 subunit delta [Anaerolineaceae bacterium]|nr:ATP synthase F1 subunit delta [Anaerolineaceae bacterium]
MKDTVLPNRYAKAVLQLALEARQTDQVGSQLAVLAEACLSDGLSAAFWQSTKVPAEVKRRALEDILQAMEAREVVRNTANMLLDRRRFAILPDLAAAYVQQVRRLAGSVEATILSAAELPEQMLDLVRDELGRKIGKTILVRTEVDPELIGGIRVRVGNLIIDGSVRGRLEAVGRMFL